VLDQKSSSLLLQTLRTPNLKRFALIKRQLEVVVSYFVGHQPVAIVHWAPKPVTENAERTADFSGVFSQKTSRIFGLRLRLAEYAQHFCFWLT
jgi:hypothetical protein